MQAQQDLTPQQKTLLVFIGDAGPQELDPIRIQKGQFLIAMEAPREWLPAEARYTFEPYNYGPYSPRIYADLDRLEHKGYIRSEEVRGQSWRYYSLTPAGRRLSRELSLGMPTGLIAYMEELRAFVTRLSFDQLLNAVYRRYPAFAVNSVFNRQG